MKTFVSIIIIGLCSAGLLFADCTGGQKPQCSSNSDCSSYSTPYPANCTSGYGQGNTDPSTETIGSHQVDLMTYTGGTCSGGLTPGNCAGGTKILDLPDTTQPYAACGVCASY